MLDVNFKAIGINFARNGTSEVVMKLKEQIKYEKYSYILFMIAKQLRIVFTMSCGGSGLEYYL